MGENNRVPGVCVSGVMRSHRPGLLRRFPSVFPCSAGFQRGPPHEPTLGLRDPARRRQPRQAALALTSSRRSGAGEDARVLLLDHLLRRDRGEEVELPVHDLPRLWIGLDLLSERQTGRTQPGELRRVFIGRCRERSPIAGVREQVARLVPLVADRRISRMSRLWPRRKLTTAPSGSW